MAERIESIIKFLKASGSANPRAVKTLTNSINALFMKKLEDWNDMEKGRSPDLVWKRMGRGLLFRVTPWGGNGHMPVPV